MADNELRRELAARHSTNSALRIVISGDSEARHGDVIHILDLIRSAGIDKVGFDIRPAEMAGGK
jgi:biopolymer transport protein ExbD